MHEALNHVLSNDMLRRCAQRAAGYDRDNRFFSEDFAELKDAGYLTMVVPREFGGRGLTLAQSCRE
jgi:alkylation response protein AidB-like acyl-CoA dehydrogenase